MTDEEGAGQVRAELDRLAAGAPPVGFTAADVVGQGRRRRRARRGAAIGGTAAALALVVAVPAVALRDPGPAGTGVADGPAGTATPPSPTPAGLRVPGLTPAQADRIARACAASLGGVDGVGVTPVPTPSEPAGTPSAPAVSPGGPVGTPSAPAVTPSPTGREPETTPSPVGSPPEVVPNRTPSPTPARPTPSPTPRGWDGDGRQDEVRVYNRIEDEVGQHVLVYGPRTYLSCDREGTRWSAGGGGLDTAWLPGPVTVDAVNGMAPPRSAAGVRSGPGYVLVEGRASREVARVTVVVNADRAEVPTVNGTFLVRFVKPATWSLPDMMDLTVTARDQDGRALAEVGPQPGPGCWVDPSGRIVAGDRTSAPALCRPATPWR